MTSKPDKDVEKATAQPELEQALEKGYIGITPDPTPNENYALTTGPDAPTPETDPSLASEVGSTRFVGGVGEEVK